MNIIFVRHGETEWNILNKLQGRVDIQLNDEGRRQAKVACQNLKDEKIDLIIASPLGRTVETAAIIASNRDIEILTDDNLLERDFGALQGMDRDAIDIKSYWNLAKNLAISDGENIQQFVERISNFLKYLKEHYEGKNILLVSHGGVSIALQYLFEGASDDGVMPTSIKNCGILKYKY